MLLLHKEKVQSLDTIISGAASSERQVPRCRSRPPACAALGQRAGLPGLSVPCGLWHEVNDKLDVFFDDSLFTSRVVLICDSLSVLILLVSEPRVIFVTALVCDSFAR